MALLFRTSQTQRFVSAADPDFVAEGARMVSDRWAYADGQPDGCTVFEVRPLSDAEMAEFVAAEVEADGDADALAAVQRRMALAALRSLDGKPVSDNDGAPWVDNEPLPALMVALVCSLVLAATQSPLAGLVSLSTAESA